MAEPPYDPLNTDALLRRCSELGDEITRHQEEIEKLAAARARVILALHGSGLSLRQIGAGLQLSGHRVYQIVTTARKLAA